MSTSNRSRQFLEIEIEKLIYGGDGLSRHQGKVVFVPYSAPGDRLLIRSVLEKKNYIRGEIVKILLKGPGRSNPICPHFGKCGGCQWQHLDYPQQLHGKEQILREIFHHRFPYTQNLPISITACPTPFAYRSRARVQIRNSNSGTSVGFFRSGSHTVEAIEFCPLLRAPLNRALHSLRLAQSDAGISGDVMECDIAGSYEEDLWTAAPAGDAGKTKNTRPLPEDKAREKEVVLKRKVGGFLYRIAASVFFQANDFLISELVRLVREMAEGTRTDVALDLFAGVGLFTLPLSGHFKSVIAVENSPPASRFCRDNAWNAGIGNVQIVCAGVAQWMESIRPATLGKIDLILLDPPRSGAGTMVMEQIRALSPQTILYVSCDPQTLSRDLSCIPFEEYRIDRIIGLDMFPQTYHFETVVRLTRR
jgi:23S rRNA (uracil1939-C5)-methyltransferase